MTVQLGPKQKFVHLDNECKQNMFFCHILDILNHKNFNTSAPSITTFYPLLKSKKFKWGEKQDTAMGNERFSFSNILFLTADLAKTEPSCMDGRYVQRVYQKRVT